MHDVRRSTRAIRTLTAAGGVLAFVGGITITFANEPPSHGAVPITDSNIEFGR